jgi:uncharacterized membrane protein
MRNSMGSWPFVFGFMAAMVLWAAVNTLLIQRLANGKPFDPYPYILLNLMLSTLAGMQGAILLISAKRADQISSEVALHTEHTADDIKELLVQNTDLTQAVETLTREVHERLIGGPK